MLWLIDVLNCDSVSDLICSWRTSCRLWLITSTVTSPFDQQTSELYPAAAPPHLNGVYGRARYSSLHHD